MCMNKHEIESHANDDYAWELSSIGTEVSKYEKLKLMYEIHKVDKYEILMKLTRNLGSYDRRSSMVYSSHEGPSVKITSSNGIT